MTNKKKIILIGSVTLIGLAIIGTIMKGPEKKEQEKQIVIDKTKDNYEKDHPEKEESNWNYQEGEDKMTSEKIYFASIESKELLQFQFPFDGGVTATLTIRNKDKKNDVYLKVEKGQFNCTIEGMNIKIRFDDEQPITFNCVEPSDGSMDKIFIHNTSMLISKLKKTKQIIIQAEFYNEGLKQMTFNVLDFQWDHK